ncbi:alpha-amylase family protein [Cohnella terricola]|uniref:Family 10 glycosylhydrolase n=1 Tax=Cohnella terricola TaxID=1289167 RepID=A0A559JSX7_9BACL|nr:alpha-amylase family protein [Cohnella terricola]TVY02975.1 family 10 glycosylhydrolase [Cohnella terricola]
MRQEWFKEHIRQVHVDFHMPEFPTDAINEFDAKSFVAEFVRADVNVIGVFTKCHFGNAYYPTKVGHKHSGLEGDFFGEVLQEAHRSGIKVIAYYSLGTDAYAVQQNPDWYQINEDGQVRGSAGTVWELPCLNSPYREELVIPQVLEIMNSYDMDGWLFDIPYIDGHRCFCPYCKKKFKEENGLELTVELYRDNPKIVHDFARNSAERCMQELYDLIKSIRPHVMVNCNGAWKMGESDAINATSDYGLWESQPASGSYLCHSIKARYTRNLDVPVQIMTVRFTEDWGMMSCKTPEQLKYEFASILANGGIINIGDQVLPNGRLQSGVYDVIGEAFHFVKERETFCIGTRSVPHIAVISNNTSSWYWDSGDAAMLGASKVLIEGHHQYDMFYNDAFPDLSAYRVVILPETVSLSDESLSRIRAFVKAGGVLLAAGEASLNRTSKRFELADVLGVDYLDRSPYEFGYFTENESLWKGITAIPQLLEAPFLKVRASTAQPLSWIQWPLTVPAPNRAFRYRIPPAGNVSAFPSISVNDYGQGKAIYIAAPVFSTYWNTNHYWIRSIVDALLDKYDLSKPFRVDAPTHMEANLMRSDDTTYLHLINFQNNHTGSRSASSYDPIERIWPIHDIVVQYFDDSVQEATLLPENVSLPFRRLEHGIELIVPSVHIHSTIAFK